jgi:hypothetical protein
VTLTLPIDDAQFLQAAVTMAVGALIFLTLERRRLYGSTYAEPGDEQRKYASFTERLEKLDAKERRKRRQLYVLSFLERWALVVMFFLLLISIAIIVLGRDFDIYNLPMSRLFFVASLVSLFLRVYLHGLR